MRIFVCLFVVGGGGFFCCCCCVTNQCQVPFWCQDLPVPYRSERNEAYRSLIISLAGRWSPVDYIPPAKRAVTSDVGAAA